MYYDFDKAVTRGEALRLILENSGRKAPTEYVPLMESLGRILAEDQFSANTLPVYRVSSFDGYAVKSAAFAHGRPDTSQWVRGVDYVGADTGDDFPDDFDAVIAVEDCSFDTNGTIRFAEDLEEIKPGTNTRRPGTTLAAGALLAAAGTRITPEVACVLATGGVYLVPCRRKPVVAFLPTGTELVAAGITPMRGQNVDSNSLLLSGMIREMGGEPLCWPITTDNREMLSRRLDEAVERADIVIINGGTSKGGEDFNSHLLQEKSTFFRHGVKAVPGRPVGIAVIQGKPAINIPGPSMAAWLAADWLLRGIICDYLGIPVPQRRKVTATVTEDVRKGPKFEMLRRVIVTKGPEGYKIHMIPRSADMAATMVKANGILIVPIGSEGYRAGQEAEVELFGGLETVPEE